MMKLRFTTCLLLTLICVGVLNARPRTISEAKNVAANHYNSLQLLRSAQDVDFELVYTGETNGLRSSSDPYYYVFNVSDAKGFVMVSGDDRILPVLGYSTDGSFDPAHIPSNMLGWLKGYEKQIDYALSLPATRQPVVISQTRSDDQFPDHVAPLVKTEWGQGMPYNDLCPMDDDARSVTGCVATSLSQVMYYHQWPVKGQGKITYHAPTLDRDISVNFEDYTFDWANMTEKYDSTSTAAQNKAVAELMYAAGTASQMNYSSTVSAAYSAIADGALKTYLGYDKNLYCKSRDYCSSSEWVALIKNELASKRPVVYGGNANIGGHSFVCDGYDKNNLFHINWGWYGYFNGYFQLDILNPYLPYDMGYGGFSYWQDVIIGIQKPTVESEEPEGALLQFRFNLSADKYAQGDSLIASGSFMYEGSATKEIEVALTLYADTGLYKILSKGQAEFDPTSIYSVGVMDTIAPFSLPVGEYYLQYVYRLPDEKEWRNVKCRKFSNSRDNYILESTTDSLHVWIYSTELASTKLTADRELYQDAAVTFRTKIKNGQAIEVDPRISILYGLTGEEGDLKVLTTEGIYLSPNEEKELLMPAWLDMEPGVYDFWVCYEEKDGYYHFVKGDAATFEVKAQVTANEKLDAPSDLKVALSDKMLFVNSDSPVRQISIFDLNGKQLHQIMPDATEVTLPLGEATPGVYVVSIMNATGWHRYKMVF